MLSEIGLERSSAAFKRTLFDARMSQAPAAAPSKFAAVELPADSDDDRWMSNGSYKYSVPGSVERANVPIESVGTVAVDRADEEEYRWIYSGYGPGR